MNELTLSECSKRRLDDTYIVVYAIKNEINIKKAEELVKSGGSLSTNLTKNHQIIHYHIFKVEIRTYAFYVFYDIRKRDNTNVVFLIGKLIKDIVIIYGKIEENIVKIIDIEKC